MVTWMFDRFGAGRGETLPTSRRAIIKHSLEQAEGKAQVADIAGMWRVRLRRRGRWRARMNAVTASQQWLRF